MPDLSVMFKTVSSDCNLDCSYCYYRESLEGTRPRRRLELSLLEVFFPDYFAYVADVKRASFVWQGGEPTLAGLDFFERLVALQIRHARPGTTIANSLQTNGMLLDARWASFLRQYGFLVGISLDGPEAMHDASRKGRSGKGSHGRVVESIRLLQAHKVDFNVLCVLGPSNIDQPQKLVAYYRKLGVSHVQFLPAMDFQATDPALPPRYLIDSEQYATFLKGAFDAWYRGGRPDVSIRIFDALLQNQVGLDQQHCVFSSSCKGEVVLECNGDIFPCDFYVHASHRLGNVRTRSLAEILSHPSWNAFVGQKRPLPASCSQCPWLSLCQSGCARNRHEGQPEEGNFFCRAYRELFAHGAGRLSKIGVRIENHRRAARARLGGLEPKANEPCLCGSGKRHKTCCGDRADDRSYLYRELRSKL